MKVIIALLLGVQGRHHSKSALRERLLQIESTGQRWDPAILDVINEDSYTTGHKNEIEETLNPAATEPKAAESIAEIDSGKKKESDHFVDRAADLFDQ